MSEIVISVEVPDDTSPSGYYPIPIDSAPSHEAAVKYIAKPPKSVSEMLENRRESGVVLVAREGNELESSEFGTAIAASLYDGKRVSPISCKNTKISDETKEELVSWLAVSKIGVNWLSAVFNAYDPYYTKLFFDRIRIGYRTFKYNHVMEMALNVSEHTNDPDDGELIRGIVKEVAITKDAKDISSIYSKLFTPRAPNAGIYARGLCHLKMHTIDRVPVGNRTAFYWADGIYRITTLDFQNNIFKKMELDLLKKNIPAIEILLAMHAVSHKESESVR